MSREIGEFSAEGRKKYNALWNRRQPGETVMDVERRERELQIPPIPDGLCGEGGCVFKAGHESEHSWGGQS